MLKVSDLAKTKLPKEFLALLPVTCPKCGSYTVITETLSMLSCSNKACSSKTVQRTVMMLAELGIKNLGASRVEDFLDTYKQNSPYALIAFVNAYPRMPVLGSKSSEEFTRGIVEQFKDKLKMPLWEFIRLGNMPKIKDSARKIFQNYDNLELFYQDLEQGGVTFLQELLGIKTQVEKTTGITEMRFLKHLAEHKIVNNVVQHAILSTFLDNFGSLQNTLEVMNKGLYNHDDIHVKGQWLTSEEMQNMLHGILKEFIDKNTKQLDVTSVTALDVFNTLMENKEELLFYVKQFQIEPIKKLYINICISTSVGYPYTSKIDFEQEMKKKYGEQIQLNFLKSVTKDCNVLICGNKEMQTSKLQKAVKLQQTGHAIAIMTGEEFDNYMSTSYTY